MVLKDFTKDFIKQLIKNKTNLLDLYEGEDMEWIDFQEYNELLKDIFQDNDNKYLCYMKPCNWLGGEGVRIVENYEDIINFNYDFTLSLEYISNKNKVVRFRVYSHDVPTGATLLVVKLNNKELNKISKFNNFSQFKEFLERLGYVL